MKIPHIRPKCHTNTYGSQFYMGDNDLYITLYFFDMLKTIQDYGKKNRGPHELTIVGGHNNTSKTHR